MAQTRLRTKVYLLDDQTWADKGAGWAVLLREGAALVVEVQTDDGTDSLLRFRVEKGINYRRQQAAIITWENFGPPEREVALSFQDNFGCDAVWRAICEEIGVSSTRFATQGADPAASVEDDGGVNDDGASSSSSSSDSDDDMQRAGAGNVAESHGPAATVRERGYTDLFAAAAAGELGRLDDRPDTAWGSSFGMSMGHDRAGEADDEGWEAIAAADGRAESSSGLSGGASGALGRGAVGASRGLYGQGEDDVDEDDMGDIGPHPPPGTYSASSSPGTVSRGVAGILSSIMEQRKPAGPGFPTAGSLLSGVGATSAMTRTSSAASTISTGGGALPPAGFPVVSLATVPAIADALEALTRGKREDLARIILDNNCAYLRRLFEVFDEAEDLGDEDTLVLFRRIILSILLCNDSLVYEALTTADLFPSTVACFEYSVDQPHQQLRAFLLCQVRFRVAIPHLDGALLERIHQNFRLLYLKDSLLPRNFDENVLGTLASTVFFNNTDIVAALLKDTSTLESVFSMVRDVFQAHPSAMERHAQLLAAQQPPPPDAMLTDTAASTASDSQPSAAAAALAAAPLPDAAPASFPPLPQLLSDRERALLFLQELAVMAKSLSLPNRQAFYRALSNCKPSVWSLFEGVLCDRHASVAELVAALEVMAAIAQSDVLSLRDLREYCQKQTSRRPPEKPRDAAAMRAAAAANATPPLPGLPDAEAAALLCSPAIPVDDGRSIRLYEKLHSLARSGELGGLVGSRSECESFNERRLGAGEHGVLIEGVTRQSGLVFKLVWRLVDDPDTTIQALCADLLRLLHCSDAPTVNAVPDTTVAQLFDFYFRWLIAPFAHFALLEAPDPRPVLEKLDLLKPAEAAASAAVPAAGSDTPRAPTAVPSPGAGEVPPPTPSDASVPVPGGAGDDLALFPAGPACRAIADGLAPVAAAARVGGESMISKCSKLLVLELLSSILSAQRYRFKFATIPTKVLLLTRVACLLRYSERHVVLAALRFIRAYVGTKDAFFCKQAATERVLSAVLAALLRNGPRTNLLNSAVLELLCAIAECEVPELVSHVITAYLPLLRRVVPQAVVLKLEQAASGTQTGPTVSATTSFGSGGSGNSGMRGLGQPMLGSRFGIRRSDEDEDELYFDRDDDDDDMDLSQRYDGGPGGRDSPAGSSVAAPPPQSAAAPVALVSSAAAANLRPAAVPVPGRARDEFDFEEEGQVVGPPVPPVSPAPVTSPLSASSPPARSPASSPARQLGAAPQAVGRTLPVASASPPAAGAPTAPGGEGLLPWPVSPTSPDAAPAAGVGVPFAVEDAKGDDGFLDRAAFVKSRNGSEAEDEERGFLVAAAAPLALRRFAPRGLASPASPAAGVPAAVEAAVGGGSNGLLVRGNSTAAAKPKIMFGLRAPPPPPPAVIPEAAPPSSKGVAGVCALISVPPAASVNPAAVEEEGLPPSASSITAVWRAAPAAAGPSPVRSLVDYDDDDDTDDDRAPCAAANCASPAASATAAESLSQAPSLDDSASAAPLRVQ